ncbi:MAG: hypothetical protein GF334_08560 [Candidatus Altiarchaeales archaeon]|nr:hypothetical protein [Candidatus Altiarchaeales archaeon]
MNTLKQILMEISKEEINEHVQENAKNEIAKKKFTNSLLDVYATIENTEKRVSDVVMTPELFSDFRKTFTDADFEHDKDRIFKGLMASMWGSNIWVYKKVPGDLKAYAEEDPSLKTDFPGIAEFKEKEGIE